MAKIYLAAPWKNKAEAVVVAQQFRDAGIEVTSRWLDLPATAEGTKDDTELETEAFNDLNDIVDADGMVVLQYQKSEGKAFEQGFYLGLAMRPKAKPAPKIVVVSFGSLTRGNVFQYMEPFYIHKATVEGAIEEVKKWENSPNVIQIEN